MIDDHLSAKIEGAAIVSATQRHHTLIDELAQRSRTMNDCYINPRDIGDPPRDDYGAAVAHITLSRAQRDAMQEIYAGHYIVRIDVTGRAYVVVGRDLP